MDSFFGIGMFELVMIAVIALVVLGPERLPAAMREIAKYMRQLREISNDFQNQFSDELKVLDEINPRKLINDAFDPNARPTQPPAQNTVKPAAPPRPSAAPPATAAPGAPGPAAPTANEPANTILPPPAPPAPAAPDAGEPAANGSNPVPPAGSSDQGAETPQ